MRQSPELINAELRLKVSRLYLIALMQEAQRAPDAREWIGLIEQARVELERERARFLAEFEQRIPD